MSIFDDAIAIVLRHEGGYTCNPNDAGGPTKYGISLRYLIEQDKKTPQFFNDNNFHFPKDLTYIDIKKLSMDDAKKIYYKYFWLAGHFDRICFQPLAIKAFDLSLTMGVSQLIKLLQRAYNHIELYKQLVIDGVLGDKTAIAINLSPSQLLYDKFIIECINYYTNLANENPKDKTFLSGWINRTNEFPVVNNS